MGEKRERSPLMVTGWSPIPYRNEVQREREALEHAAALLRSLGVTDGGDE